MCVKRYKVLVLFFIYGVLFEVGGVGWIIV